MNKNYDPFQEARKQKGVMECPFHGENIAMVLRHADVVKAAKDWETFSSDAPFRVPIPSEEEMRTMRQLPIETNPPEHTEYRAIVEPFFQQVKEPEMMAKVEGLIHRLLDVALASDSIEVVHEFALPFQSRALTYLLNVPESDAETWIKWGVRVLEIGKSSLEFERALEHYLDRAESNPGDDFFSALVKATYRGRKLTRPEMMGFANLVFAGGRDTIIHTVSCVLAYLGKHPEALDYLREDKKRIPLASEEFFRIISPITQLGRVCPSDTEVHGVTVKADHRISLCWASANRDEAVFPAADEVKLDRKPNPHVAFGIGAHFCLGAPHARLLTRSLLRILTERVARITVIEDHEHVEKEACYQRTVGYESLVVKLTPLSKLSQE
ncbi:MAG: cytochrome P450 [Verrucomicrobiota bacterium]